MATKMYAVLVLLNPLAPMHEERLRVVWRNDRRGFHSPSDPPSS